MSIQVAVIQQPPVLLDLAKSLERAVELLSDAARAGARLVVFPEAYLPGYPTWVWRLKPGGDMGVSKEIHAEFSGTTLFNTVVTIGPDGTILNRHRKLLPTNPERMVWGRGDGSGLRVVDSGRSTAGRTHPRWPWVGPPAS